MTEAEYQKARASVLQGEDPPRALMEECRRSVRMMVRTRGLPAHYSLVGTWSEEAIEEAFADWTAARLVERGQLKAMLQRSPALKVFGRACETSVRQHLIDRLKRSQSANLYARVRALLEGGESFLSTGSGSTVAWRLKDGPQEPASQEDHALLGVAWGLGDFDVIRYDAAAKKLAPLLGGGELERFVTGMLGAGAMTVGTLVRAMEMRFGIDAQAAPVSLDEGTATAGTVDPEKAAVTDDLVAATLAELTSRQRRVLIGRSDSVPVRELAKDLGCSAGTVSHELRMIEAVLARLGTDAPEVLNKVLDALLKEET
jgi:hypothetical protein